jgi:putative ABC transport system substrate-binding protein
MTVGIGRRRFIALAGSALAFPFAARAQVGKIPRIGVLWHAANPKEEEPYFSTLLKGFSDLGYAECRNISFEHRFPNELPERFKSMAEELVTSNVDVLVSVSGTASIYAKNATSTVPIVFVFVNDPVESKLVNSLARPGGNVTGLSNFQSDLTQRRLQVFKEVVPGMSRVAQLVNPNAPVARVNIESIKDAATKLGLHVQTFDARSLADLEPAFDAMAAADMQGVTYGPGELIQFQGRDLIAKLSVARRLPLCGHNREVFDAGALMAYGADNIAICRRAAVYVDKILKGEKPAEIPVEGPTKFELLISLKTAKALGIEVPPMMLGRADDVVE